ncbi:TetR family transcriptional regulator [Mycobacterium sp. ENV421]|uniref:TetR/AcrR family transcriptional regulator n=1 Tax=Mycobacterium sp. ENV421 TaxID=1213407 RepID=UPI000C9B2530|nr:TetR/AcrR family transcriptional regulator [Mycobacterium sp. ENV421]PND59157.1 TetR family transcriptional regulator [Mycobacterium sp. ENV421]
MSRSVGQHHGDLRRALIGAALELVAESDTAGVTLRAVARRAGVSAAAPYHHFADKDALLAAVARDGFDALSDVQRAVLSGPGSAQDRLQEMVEQYVLFALSHRTHYRLMFRTLPTEVAGGEGEALRDAAMSAFGRLVEAIQAANPPLSVEEAGRRAIVAWSLAHGAVDVARWGQALRPGLDGEALAADAGRAAGQLAVDH